MGRARVIVRRLADLTGGERDVAWGNGRSRRFLLQRDGMGYTLTDTVVEAGTEALLEYRNHLETCYCIEGRGEVETLDGTVHPLEPGVMYALDGHEPHYLRASERMRLVCVFAPALQGHEAHRLDADEAHTY